MGAELGVNKKKEDEAAMVVAVDVSVGGWRAEWVGRGLVLRSRGNRRGRVAVDVSVGGWRSWVRYLFRVGIRCNTKRVTHPTEHASSTRKIWLETHPTEHASSTQKFLLELRRT